MWSDFENHESATFDVAQSEGLITDLPIIFMSASAATGSKVVKVASYTWTGPTMQAGVLEMKSYLETSTRPAILHFMGHPIFQSKF